MEHTRTRIPQPPIEKQPALSNSPVAHAIDEKAPKATLNKEQHGPPTDDETSKPFT
jgi:hypothetical protein